MTSVGGLYYSVKCFGDVKGNLKKTQPKPYNMNTNTPTYTKRSVSIMTARILNTLRTNQTKPKQVEQIIHDQSYYERRNSKLFLKRCCSLHA